MLLNVSRLSLRTPRRLSLSPPSLYLGGGPSPCHSPFRTPLWSGRIRIPHATFIVSPSVALSSRWICLYLHLVLSLCSFQDRVIPRRSTMSRPYMCKKCGVSHNPPTGKKCKQDYSQDKDNDIAILAESVQQMAKSLASVTTRLDSMERETEESSVERDATSDMSDTEGATAKSLRSDSNLQKHVKSRMAALKLLDKEDTDSDTDGDDIDKQSKSVKPRNIRKSGRNRTADDVISKEIDWPHYHCYRGPDRLPARYEELSIPEFVQGYLTTALDGKQNAQTREKMLRHLQELMRDASDHRWEHVRNYHACHPSPSIWDGANNMG